MKVGIFDNYEEFLACLQLLEAFPLPKGGLEAKHLDFINTLLEECNEYLLAEYPKHGLGACLRGHLEKRIATARHLVRVAQRQLKGNTEEVKP